MKKQWRGPIILGALLVILALVWILSKFIPGFNQQTETTVELPDVPLVFEVKDSEVESLAVTNEQGGFTLLPYESRAGDGTVTINWTVDGYQDYLLSTATTKNVANLGLLLYGGKIIAEEAADLTPFGLDRPRATVTVNLKNGRSHVIAFGNELPSGYFDYAIVDNKGAVYSVASSTTARSRYSITDMLDKNALVGIDADKLTGLVLERAADNLKLAGNCSYDETSRSYLFTVTEPITRTGNTERLAALATEALNLKAAQFVEVDPPDLAKYGLDKPRYSIRLTAEDKTVQLHIGHAADAGDVYMISDATFAVFKVPATTFTTIDTPLIDLIDRLFMLKSIWLVDRIEADLPGAAFTADIEMDKNQKNDDEGTVFRLNGRDAKIFSETGRSLFSAFYQRIIGMQIAGVDAGAEPTNTRDAYLIFHLKDDPDTGSRASIEVVEFAKRDEYTYYVFINGEYAGYYINANQAFAATDNRMEGVVVAYRQLLYAMEHAVDGVFDTREGYQLD